MLEAKKNEFGRKLWKGALTSLTAIGFAVSLSRGLHAEDIYGKNGKLNDQKPVITSVAQIPGETPIPSMNLPVVQPIQGEKKEDKKKTEVEEPKLIKESKWVDIRGKRLKYVLITRDDWDYVMAGFEENGVHYANKLKLETLEKGLEKTKNRKFVINDIGWLMYGENGTYRTLVDCGFVGTTQGHVYDTHIKVNEAKLEITPKRNTYEEHLTRDGKTEIAEYESPCK